MWPDVGSGDLQVKKSMVIHDTECPNLTTVSNTYMSNTYIPFSQVDPSSHGTFLLIHVISAEVRTIVGIISPVN